MPLPCKPSNQNEFTKSAISYQEKIMKINISELEINGGNPRKISDFMLDKLVESILVFREMLVFRPVITNASKLVLGGNQRLRALKKISLMDIEDIELILSDEKKYQSLGQSEQDNILSFWEEWIENPQVETKVVTEFSEREEKEFIIKDNLNYGEDDIALLKEHFDRDLLESYTGSPNQSLLDFGDKINDEGIEIADIDIDKFVCGYIKTILTKDEIDYLEAIFSQHVEETGSTEHFVKLALL